MDSSATDLDDDFAVLGLPAFSDNYLWLMRRHGVAVAIDPGDATPILQYLDRSGDSLAAILLTHHHPDHIGGVETLKQRFNVPVFGPQKENIRGVTSVLSGGEIIDVPGLDMQFEVLDVGGHTRGHIAYYRPKILFCGDALFVLGCGRLFEGTPMQMLQSLDRIATLPRDTVVYCAHEYTHLNLPFALAVEPGNPLLQKRAISLRATIAMKQPTVPMRLGDELDTNPFLRCDVAEVIASARNFSGDTRTNGLFEHISAHTCEPDRERLRERVATFAALREWRNQI